MRRQAKRKTLRQTIQRGLRKSIRLVGICTRVHVSEKRLKRRRSADAPQIRKQGFRIKGIAKVKWQYGGAIAITIAELSAHSLAKDATQALLRKLLGPQLWEGWFGTVDIVLEHTSVLPRQLMAYLQYALSQLQHNYDALEDNKAAAAKSYALMVEDSSKKRRTIT